MSKHPRKKYVILAGGLTGGPVTPLLAVIKEWQKHDTTIHPILADIKKSTSRIIAQEHNIPFKRIITGKFRRYWSLKNFIAPILLLIGFVQSFALLIKYKPLAVIGAGGFVQIPIIIAAWILRIPRFIHQQDVSPTLSNQISSMFANLVTTTFEFSIRDFLQGTGLGKKYITTDKVIWTGNPVLVEDKHVSKVDALEEFKLHSELPVLLVLGGATGSSALNEIIIDGLPELTKVVQIVHSTGPGKMTIRAKENYHPYEFIENIDSAYIVADVVLTRAGISTLTGLAAHRKASIVVPMPDTHQEANAGLLFHAKSAIVLDQKELDTEVLVKNIRKILFDPELQESLGKNMHSLFPPHAAEKIYKLMIERIHESKHGKQSS